MTIIEKLSQELKALEDRLHRAERFDQWSLWTWENEQRLKEVKAELEAFNA